MPASLNFTTFTDDEVFLEDKEAANTFFGAITVPNATTLAYGVVLKGASVDAVEAGLSSAFALTTYRVQMLKEDGSFEYAELVDKTEAQNALNSLRTKLNSLIDSLKTAGVIN